MFWTEITTNGNFAILPAKVRGEGLNVFNSSELTDDESGTVVIDAAGGTGTVTVGFFTSVSESAPFQTYNDGLMAGTDIFVRHGKGTRLGVNVSGVAGTLRVGYAGASSQ